MENGNGNGKAHGGARVGAGRKPKALVYKAEVASAESTIVDALPRLIGKLMELAMEGNVAALKYLVDRILGRVPLLQAAPAADTSMQYVEKDFRNDLVGHLLHSRLRKEDRDLVMSDMDLEGTDLEYEFEDEDEDEEEEGEGEQFSTSQAGAAQLSATEVPQSSKNRESEGGRPAPMSTTPVENKQLLGYPLNSSNSS